MNLRYLDLLFDNEIIRIDLKDNLLDLENKLRDNDRFAFDYDLFEVRHKSFSTVVGISTEEVEIFEQSGITNTLCFSINLSKLKREVNKVFKLYYEDLTEVDIYRDIMISNTFIDCGEIVTVKSFNNYTVYLGKEVGTGCGLSIMCVRSKQQ